MIFNLGAPSQLDLLDLKPQAPAEIRGPFKPLKTASPDIQISEIFPLHAKIADKFSLVRVCYHTAAAVHDTGHQMMQTGRLFTGGVNTPHVGCASSTSGAAKRAAATSSCPSPWARRRQHAARTGRGFLGKAYDPFVLNADPSKAEFKVPDLLPPQEIGEARLDRRRKMRDIVDDTVKNFEASENAELMDSNFQSAFRLMTSRRPARRST